MPRRRRLEVVEGKGGPVPTSGRIPYVGRTAGRQPGKPHRGAGQGGQSEILTKLTPCRQLELVVRIYDRAGASGFQDVKSLFAAIHDLEFPVMLG